MALMFGRNARNQQKNVVEFRAGKMTLKGNMVHPDKRKGLVYIYQSEDGLTHFCWKDRTSGVVEDDLIIFPEDAVFSKVTQCKGEDRVFLLKFKASSRKMFYWMQEPKADGDSDVIFKVNEAINNPGAAASSSSRGGGSGSATTTPSEQEMHTLLSSMSQSQLMQLIGGMNDLGGVGGPSGLLAQMGLGGGLTPSGTPSSSEGRPTTTTTGGATATAPAAAPATSSSTPKKTAESSSTKPTSSSGSSKPAVQLQDLQKILSGIQAPAATVDLAAGVNSEFVKRITSNPTTVQKLAPLLPNFGLTSSDGKQSDEKNVTDTLISPAFQHALSSFCSAFPSGQLGPLVEQFEFGTDAVAAARSGNLEAFLNAIQKDADSKPQQGSTEKPEDMNVD